MAAVLACGEGAVLSHRSAAGLGGLLPATSGPVHVSVAGIGGRKKRRGIRIHRSRTLTRAMLRRHQNIPVTCPARTVADLARSVTAADLRKAIRQAEVLGLPLGHEHEPDATRSELEHDFLRLCRLHHLPPPEVNVQVGPYVVDFLWRDRSLVAETDGYRYHRGRLAFEDDRARDLQLRLLGYEVVRFTYRQVRDDPAGVAAALRKILSPRVPPFRHL
jgi:very-short-patch-repair endonuclease